MIDTTSKISLKPHYTVIKLNQGNTLLTSERAGYLLRSHVFDHIIPLLNGALSADEITSRLLNVVPPEKAYHALIQLLQNGHIIYVKGKLPKERAAFWYGINADAPSANDRLIKSKVSIQTIGCTKQDVKSLGASLGKLGIRITNTGNADLNVVITNDYLNPQLKKLNRTFHNAEKDWLLVKPAGQVLWLGPLFSSTDKGCWECLAHRLKENRPYQIADEENLSNASIIAEASIPMSRAIGLELAATEIAKWIVLEESRTLRSTVVTLDLLTLETHSHQVRNQASCPTCGDATRTYEQRLADAQRPLKLQKQHKKFTSDGGYRIFRPEETLEHLEPFISPITGIIPGLNKADTYGPVHVYYAQHTFPMNVSLSENRIIGQPSWAAGKGATEVQAKVSCIAEAIERYSAGYQKHDVIKKSLYKDIEANAIHPNQLAHFSAQQYETRNEWNESQAGFNWIPLPFDDSQEIDWTPNWSLTHECVRWLPAAYCYLNYPSPDEHKFYQGDANGCASGNSIEEAILQGFFELVERDAMALWWYNRLQRHPIDINSFGMPYFAGMKTFYEARGRVLEVMDISSDLGLCSVVAVSWVADSGGHIQIGLGTHLDAKVAISRALSELNQLLAYNDTESNVSDPHVREWFETATRENQPYIVPDYSVVMTAENYPRHYSDDLLTDIETCVELAKKQNLEVLVLDMTRADINFPAVRVTIPGLRHFWARSGPGRLYDVPVKMGWLTEPVTEKDLNPTPFFL